MRLSSGHNFESCQRLTNSEDVPIRGRGCYSTPCPLLMGVFRRIVKGAEIAFLRQMAMVKARGTHMKYWSMTFMGIGVTLVAAVVIKFDTLGAVSGILSIFIGYVFSMLSNKE